MITTTMILKMLTREGVAQFTSGKIIENLIVITIQQKYLYHCHILYQRRKSSISLIQDHQIDEQDKFDEENAHQGGGGTVTSGKTIGRAERTGRPKDGYCCLCQVLIVRMRVLIFVMVVIMEKGKENG